MPYFEGPTNGQQHQPCVEMGPNDGEAPGRDSKGSHSQGQIHHRRRPDHQQHHPDLLVESSEKIEIKNCEKGTSIRWNSFGVK